MMIWKRESLQFMMTLCNLGYQCSISAVYIVIILDSPDITKEVPERLGCENFRECLDSAGSQSLALCKSN